MNIKIQPLTQDNIQFSAYFCSKIGYKGIVLEIPHNSEKKEHFHCVHLPIWTRTTLIPTSKGTSNLKAVISPLRPQREVLALNCPTPLITKWAAQDQRIDLLNFPISDIRRLFDNSTAKTIASFEGTKAVELNIGNLIYSPLGRRMGILRAYRHIVSLAIKKECPFVLSSGATTSYELRGPLDLASLATIFQCTLTLAKDALSVIPFQILKRNLEKRRGEQISPGIERVNHKSD